MTHEAGSSWYHLWVLYNLFQTELFPVIFQVKFFSWFVSPWLIFLRAEFFPCWFFALLTFFLFDFLLVKLFLVESFFLKYFLWWNFFWWNFFLVECGRKAFHLTSFKTPFPRTPAHSCKRFIVHKTRIILSSFSFVFVFVSRSV